MKTVWTAGLNAQEKKEIVEDFKSSQGVRTRLETILTKKIDSERSSKLSKVTYESPSWGFVQADANGYERALREVISLLQEKEVEN